MRRLGALAVLLALLAGCAGTGDAIAPSISLANVALNYRLQALEETDRLPAFAPRVSLLLPTGSEDKGAGAGVVQHILNLQRADRDWFLSFTQEWPV